MIFLFYDELSEINLSSSTEKSRTDKSLTERHQEVQSYFSSNEEIEARYAMWKNSNEFRVAVLNNGMNKDGYARYVCSILTSKFRMSGTSLYVAIYDFLKISNQGKWEKIGGYSCSKQ